MKKFLLATAIFLAFTLSFSIFATPASAATDFSGTITGDVVWTKADSPYVIHGALIPTGSSLTIEPGTILKIQPWATVSVYGTLTIGTPDATEQVFVTSIKDDSVGGDTNGDGGDSTPQVGDWRNIIAFPGSTVTLAHTTLRYGGQRTGYDYRCNGPCGY